MTVSPRDIDADERAGVTLIRREQAYRSLIEATSAGIWRWSLGGAYVHAPAWDFPEAYEGEAWLSGVHPEDRPGALVEWLTAKEKEAPTTFEFRARLKSGDYRWCVVHAAPVRDASGTVVEWIGNLVDVHDERAARAALQRRDRLEAIGRLTAGVAHDFNNMLTVITGATESLASGLERGHPLQTEARSALHAAERGAQLVHQLLSISRQQPLRPRPVDAQKLLRSLTGLLMRTVPEDVEVICHEAASDLFCAADPALLESALLNLCLNARDAMPGGGRLELSAHRQRYPLETAEETGVASGDYVVFTVRDNGAGMSPEALDHALDPFFTTKTEGKGFGLGLSTAFGFARQSGGNLLIRSRLGEGAVVTVYLPACEAPAARAPAGDPVRTTGAMQILLVEDDELVLSQVARQLRALGHEVRAVADAMAALDRLAGETFDLLITDVVMPGGMNGRRLADQARLLRPTLPVLFTSGYTTDMIVRDRRLGPGSAFLPKPYRRAQLAEAIEAAVRASAGVG